MSKTTLKTTPANGDKGVIGAIEYVYSAANKRWESTGLPVASLSSSPSASQTVTSQSPIVTPMILKGSLGQTANVFQVEDDTGKSLFDISPLGGATFGGDVNFAGHINGVVETDPKTKIQRITQTVPSANPLVIESMAGSTVNALEFSNGGTVNASIDKNGVFHGPKLSINTATASHVLNIGCSANGSPYAINIDASSRTAGEGSHEFIEFTGVGALGTVFSVDGNGLVVSKKVKADAGSIHTLTSTTGTIGTLHSTTGTIATLKSTTATLTSATIPTLTSTTGTITNLKSTKGTIDVLHSTLGVIDRMLTKDAQITNGTVSGKLSQTAGPTSDWHLANKKYVDAQDKLHLKKTTDTFTGTLTVTGGIKASGDIWAYSTSDRRVKADIKDMPDDALERNKVMSGKTFTRTDRDDEDIRYAGLIAQDIQEAIPEAVEEGDDGILRYDSAGVIAHLVNCVNALTTENDHIKFRMQMLEEKLDSLTNQD